MGRKERRKREREISHSHQYQEVGGSSHQVLVGI
jgi:hypothetical protein